MEDYIYYDKKINFNGYEIEEYKTNKTHYFYAEKIMINDFIDFIKKIENETDLSYRCIKLLYQWECETLSLNEEYNTILPYQDDELTRDFKNIDELKEWLEQYEGFFDNPVKAQFVDYSNNYHIGIIEIYYLRDDIS